MAHAQSLGADTIINTGGVQSNQIRQTAGAAARLGMECHLLLARQPTLITPNYEHTGNILVCRMLGAHIHFVEHDCDREAAMQALASQLRDQRKKPYVIPVGASSPEGILGSAMCGEEILYKHKAPDFRLTGWQSQSDRPEHAQESLLGFMRHYHSRTLQTTRTCAS